MLPKIRVLIVDDSVVVRRILSEALSSHPRIEVVGVADSGFAALAKITQLLPDVVTLDVEMPGISGLQTLASICRDYPKIAVIMFSSITERDAQTTLQALSLGAKDYVTKPSQVANREAAMAHVSAELLPKIIALGTSPIRNRPTSTPLQPLNTKTTQNNLNILAVGASTGGPNALEKVLSALPQNFPVPILIVQHMPPVFTRLFSERLTQSCKIPCHEGEAGQTLQPGHAYVAPGGFHMFVVRSLSEVRIGLNQAAQENSCRPAVDVLFRSVAQVFGGATLAVVLTGMGQDGLRGCELIRAEGGQVIVQDEATSVVWGMPGFIAQAGLAHAVLPLDNITNDIMMRINKANKTTSLQAHAHVD